MNNINLHIYTVVLCVTVSMLLACESNTEEKTEEFELNGFYKVEMIRALYQNKITGVEIDTVLTTGTFSTFSGIEPLDVIEVGESMFFDNSNYYSERGEDDKWKYEFPFELRNDIATNKPKFLTIYYYDTVRIFSIITSTNEILVLRSSGQWQGASPEGTFLSFVIYLNKQ